MYKNLLSNEEIAKFTDIHHRMLEKISGLFSKDFRRFVSPQKLRQKINDTFSKKNSFVEKIRPDALYRTALKHNLDRRLLDS